MVLPFMQVGIIAASQTEWLVLWNHSPRKTMQLVSHKVIQKQMTNVTELSFLLHSGTNLFFLSIAHSFFPQGWPGGCCDFFLGKVSVQRSVCFLNSAGSLRYFLVKSHLAFLLLSVSSEL